MRNINRICLPSHEGRVDLPAYLKTPPWEPQGTGIAIHGFLNQYLGVENKTGHVTSVVLSSQQLEADRLPLILDIGVEAHRQLGVGEWGTVRDIILGLRRLKNEVFLGALTEKCLSLFQQQWQSAPDSWR